MRALVGVRLMRWKGRPLYSAAMPLLRTSLVASISFAPMLFAASFEMTSMGQPTSWAAAVAKAPINVARNIGFDKLDGTDEVVAQKDTTGLCFLHGLCLEQIIEGLGVLLKSGVVVLVEVVLMAGLKWLLIHSEL